MRHRNVHVDHNEPDAESSRTVNRIVKQVRQLDILYPKADAEEDMTIRTNIGAVMSITVLTIMAILFLSELYSYLHVNYARSITVDVRTGRRMPIFMNITFPSLRCSLVSLDVMDVSGETHVDASTNVFRTRLDRRGYAVGGLFQDIHDVEHAGDVAHAHGDQAGEGCHISVELSVNRVAGNVHIALGGQHNANSKLLPGSITPPAQKHIHQFLLHEMQQYNASHTIDHLSFGTPFPLQYSPLDGATQSIDIRQGISAHFQYFIKIVPTIYTYSDGRQIDSAQYSVTSQTHYITLADAYRQDSRRIPGLFFVYDLSPFMVGIKEKVVPLSTFLCGVCAIVGGVFSVVGLLDGIIHSIMLKLKPFIT